MVNSTWTNQHINHLLKPFGWRDDVDDEEQDEDEPRAEASAAIVTSSDVETKGETREEGLRRRKESWKKVDEREQQLKAAEEAEARRAAKIKFRKARTVYPPCDTIALATLPLEVRKRVILTVAQFR